MVEDNEDSHAEQKMGEGSSLVTGTYREFSFCHLKAMFTNSSLLSAHRPWTPLLTGSVTLGKNTQNLWLHL